MDVSFSDLNFNSVENVPGYEARAAFTVNSSSVFKEDIDIVPTIVDDTLSYIPWGGDNQMPFDILNLIEKDETLATCQIFNAEVCYGSGLRYDTCVATAKVESEVEDFTLDNDLAAYFLGVSQDFKHFGFAVSVLILNEEGTKIVRERKPVTAASHLPMQRAEYPRYYMPTGASLSRPAPTLRLSTCLTATRRGSICKTDLPRETDAASSPSSRAYPPWTPHIIPYLITLRFSKASGTTSSSSLVLPRKRSSAIPRLSNTTSRSGRNIGSQYSVPRVSPTAVNSRSV